LDAIADGHRRSAPASRKSCQAAAASGIWLWENQVFIMARVFPFSSLAAADFLIDAVYEGGTKGNTSDDPIGKLAPGAGNQGVGSLNADGHLNALRPLSVSE